MKIQIRKAKIKDINEVMSLNQQLFDYEYKKGAKTLDCNWTSNNKEYFRKSIVNDNSLTLVAIVDDKIVGYLIGKTSSIENYRIIKSMAELDNMFISPDYRKIGIGSLLTDKFFDWAKERGIERLKVIVSANNQSAINFYKKNDFKDCRTTLEKEL